MFMLQSVSRADGSCKFTLASTTVLCTVMGPTEPKMSQERPSGAFIEVICQGERGLATKTHEAFLRDLLYSVVATELHPRASVRISVQTLSAPAPSDVGALSVLEQAAHINAAMAAVIDAAIDCRGVLCAVPAYVLPGEPRLVFNAPPPANVTALSSHLLLFGFSGIWSNNGLCLAMHSCGPEPATMATIQEIKAGALFHGKAIYDAIKLSVGKSLEGHPVEIGGQ